MQRVKNLFVALLFGFASLSVFAQNNTPVEQYNAAYESAMDLFRKGKYVAAQRQFDQLVGKAPVGVAVSEADAVYYAAVCSEELGNNDAMYRLEEFLRLYPESSKANMAYFYQGNCHYSRGEYSLALKYYNKVESNEIEYGHRDEFEYKIGYCLINTGDREKAKNHFSHIMNGKSKYKTNALYYYAHIQYMDGEYAQALRNFQKISDDKRVSGKLARIADNYIARIYYYLGREDEFLTLAPKLMQDNDVFKKEELEQMMGEVYFNRGEYDQALKYYRLSAQDSPKTTATDPATGKPIQGCVVGDNAYQIGYCYYMQHQYDSAAAYLSQKTACNDSVAQNALYTLGDTYVQLNRKSEARSMFLQASQMSYNAKIQEDALFNYAKLSCELNQNAYNESIKSFENYLSKYPKTKHKSEIQEILTSLYFTTRNYKDALTLMEKIEPKNADMNRAYQRLLINRGIELFNERNLQEASKFFVNAVKVNADVQKTADALYLNGEAQYRLDNFKSAKTALDKFFKNSKSRTSPYYRQALYTSGYLCIRNEQYANGADAFSRFISMKSPAVEDQQLCDAYNRLADCQYGQKNFEAAITSYNYSISHNGKDADYATYQKALCYGAIGKNEDKLTYLNYIFEHFEQSPLASKAMFEIANTYLVCDNNEMALLYYGNFIKQYPKSSYVKEALLDMGLIYYNTDRNEKALECFDQLLTNYQGTEEAKDALVTVKNIFIAENRVDEYFNYVQNRAKITISSSEQDSITFSVAANRYYEGDYENAITGLDSYLKKFPRGMYNLKAHYYLADCLYRKGLGEQALPHYESVASRNKNQYTETSLLNAAHISYGMNNYQQALEYYVQLLTLAEKDNSRLEGRIGILRCWNKLGSHQEIIASANELLKESKITNELKEEALISKARSYYANNVYDSAEVIYRQLTHSANGEYSGEAVYTLAEIQYLHKDYTSAEQSIENIVANPPNDYWLAKTFILWADIFRAQGNTLQAKQTLQSIIDNYDGEELVTLAIQKRNDILSAEAAASQTETESTELEIEIPFEE